jgi:hypothetical protein
MNVSRDQSALFCSYEEFIAVLRTICSDCQAVHSVSSAIFVNEGSEVLTPAPFGLFGVGILRDLSSREQSLITKLKLGVL